MGLTGIRLKVRPLDEFHARIDRFAEDPSAVRPPKSVGSGIRIVYRAIGPPGRVGRRVSQPAMPPRYRRSVEPHYGLTGDASGAAAPTT
jgi:hypothetical protein